MRNRIGVRRKEGSIVRTTTDRADVGAGVRPSWTPTDDRTSRPAGDNLGSSKIILKAFPSLNVELEGSRTSNDDKGVTTGRLPRSRTSECKDRPLDRMIEGAANRAD